MNTDTAVTHPIVRDLLQNVYSQVSKKREQWWAGSILVSAKWWTANLLIVGSEELLFSLLK